MKHPDFELLGIDHVVLRVHQLEPMLRFYRNVLGCDLVRKNEKLGLYHLAAGSSLIDLIPVDMELGKKGGKPPEREGHNVDHIAIKIHPFNGPSIIRYLLSKGIEAGNVEIRFGADGKGPSIYLKDPEGNGIELKGIPDIAKDK